MSFVPEWMDDRFWVIALRVGAVAHFVLIGLNVGVPRWLNWKADVDRMSPLVRDVFQIHSIFIMLVLGIWGVLTWRFAEEMVRAPTELSRWLCGALMVFWGLRCLMQWTHYDASHWRGCLHRTMIHWVLFFAYGGGAWVYGVVAFRT